MDNRYCVIMCGGVGSRFWPYSRSAKPKQFLDFFGTGHSLLQMTVDRLQGIVPQSNIIIVTNERYAGLIRQQLPDIAAGQILLEPARRNTAPCIAWAARHIYALNPNAQMMVAPSDHLIVNTNEFNRTVQAAFNYICHNDVILTMGVRPNRPETGYGYIQADRQIDGDFFAVKTFTEKPNAELAQAFLDSGEFFWNSGMFFWSVQRILNSLREYAPEIMQELEYEPDVYGTPQEQAYIDTHFPSCMNISIDYAVMEKAPNVVMQTVDFGWSDLGTWGALHDLSPKTREGNVAPQSRAMLYDCHDNVVAVNRNKVAVIAGLNGYIVADTDDALLIAPIADEQKIRHYVNDIKSRYGDEYL